jgi:hypothetical protein
MKGRLSRCLVASSLCALLCACSVAANRGGDSRDPNAPIGTVGANMGKSNAVGVVASPMFFEWLKDKLLPDNREDVPPPPPPVGEAKDERRNLEQDCTDPAKHPDKNLKCR